ncbi:ATP-binding cassette domain-containing protein [Streptomyces sp. NBC_00237]|uniref:ABC transporter permease subunit n=1 Tax=Streptomyces sp. NBC_00237 TaxID=2975687 RepID=UPI00225BF916|nr:ATP-binding cassette domain-containing protein [Streptomyces sp. NBC_00237]MCX5202158.1 ATP-binding cassette domain-containing protein [Streptomyces sp. NBC_00237]
MASLTYELVLAGLAIGSAAALSGIGLIVTHRATGVLNLAHGAVAMLCAYVLRQLAVDWHWPLPLAAATTLLLFAPAVGLLLDRAVFRPLSALGTDPARTLVASIAVFVLLVGGAALVWGEGARADAPEVFGDSPWPPLAAVLLLALTVGAVTRRTRFGRSLRAVVDNRPLAVLGGIDANRVAAAGWAFGSFTAGLTGVLLAPYVRLDPYGLPLLVVEVIAVAALARMRSLPVAIGAALLLGIAQSQLTRLHPEGWAGPLLQSLSANLFVVALLAAALLYPSPGPGVNVHSPTPRALGDAHSPAPRTLVSAHSPRPRPGVNVHSPGPQARGSDHSPGRPLSWRVRPLPLLVAALLLLPLLLTGNELRAALPVPATAVVLLSLVVVSGRSGQIALGQAAYAGLGALFTALLADGRLPWLPPLPVLPSLLLAVALTAPLGLLTGWPAIRRHGLALALTTLAFGVAVSRFVLNQPYATAGLGVARPAAFTSDRAYYALALGLLLLCLLLVARLRGGRSGRALAALRDHEEGASAAGVRVPLWKVLSFVVGAALAALGGGLLSMSAQAFTPTAFDPVRGLLWFAVVMLLGADRLLTACTGALLLVLLDAGSSTSLAAILTGTLLLLPGLLGQRNRTPSPLRRYRTPSLLGRRGRPPGASGASPARTELRAWGRAGKGAAPSLRAHPAAAPPSPDTAPPSSVAPPHPRTAQASSEAPPHPRTNQANSEAPPHPRTAPASPGASLQAHHLTLTYGPFTALNTVTLPVPPSRITALIGPNGAGKSTLFHLLCGTLRPTSGRITLNSVDITRHPAHTRTRLGIARTFQQLAVFPSLTVEENVLLGAEQGHRRDLPPAEATESALRLLSLDGSVRHHPAANLPTGTLRRVELARALAGRPHTLLLDEPAAGLDAAETAALARVLAALAADGTAILVVEHDLDLVADIAHTVHVLTAGALVAEPTPQEPPP